MLEKIKEIAEKQGLSISALEKKANIGNGTIARWNNSSPNLDTLQKVANALGIGLNELLE